MRRIVHLSDLNFGRLSPAMLAPLRECVRRLEPHLVVVSGGLTEGARPREFRDARAFLDSLPGPQVVVPGSRDVPSRGLFGRFATPLGRYREYIGDDLEPEYADDVVAVIGANTSEPIEENSAAEQARRVRGRVHGFDARIVKIVASHRPLLDCGADILVTGSLEQFRDREDAASKPLVVQSGAANLAGMRSDLFALNALQVDASGVSVERWTWNAHSRRFEHSGTKVHALDQGRETKSLPRM
jgi:hypothetical protein